jgi:hypothetical protein
VEEFEALADEADVVIVAPVLFGQGNLAPLRTAVRAAQAGKRVIVVATPPVVERDLSGGEATALSQELLAAGALEAVDIAQAIALAATAASETSTGTELPAAPTASASSEP